jgi:hypothetical protein
MLFGFAPKRHLRRCRSPFALFKLLADLRPTFLPFDAALFEPFQSVISVAEAQSFRET